MASIDAVVFPEDQGTGLSNAGDADFTSAGHFGGLAAHPNQSDYVAQGMNFQNVGSGTFDVSAGLAYILHTGTVQVQDNSGAYNVDWAENITLAVRAASTTGVSYTTGDVNYVFLDVDLTSVNTASYTVNTTDSQPASPSLKIGEIDDT